MSFFSGNAAAFGSAGRDLEQLFSEEGGIPASSSSGYQQPRAAPAPDGSSGFGNVSNTLDEPVWDTVKRDLLRIWRNLVLVVFPFKDRSQQSAALRNWDLWGPMVFTLTLAVTLSLGAAKPSSTFSLVFALVSVGAIVLTVNVVLLGGTIGFFQSLCLLGYCLFPLDAAALTAAFVRITLVKWLVVPVGIAWASWASVPFIAGAVPANRRALAVYPLCLLYASIGWLALVK